MQRLLAAIIAIATIGVASAFAQAPSIEEFTRDQHFWSGALSPNGRYVVGIRRESDRDILVRVDWRANQVVALQTVPRTENIEFDWVAWKSDARLIVSASTRLGYRRYTRTGSHIASREEGELPITRIFALDVNGANVTQMFEGQLGRLAAGFVSTRLVDRLQNDPTHVLIAAYGRTGYVLWRADVQSGRVENVESGDFDTLAWVTDGAGSAVIRVDALFRNSGYRIFRRAPIESRWTLALEVRGGERVRTPDFTPFQAGAGPGQVWVAARPNNQDRSALYLYDTATGAFGEPRYQHPSADLDSIWIDPRNGNLLAACAMVARRECQNFDAEIGRHIRAIDSFFEHAAEVTLVDMSDDGAVWLLRAQSPTMPPRYFVYDHGEHHVIGIDGAAPHLTPERLAPVEIVTYRGGDGTELWGYLTTPRGVANRAPLVVLPHGGPESRDSYGYDNFAQFIASRGYLVFQPQFRGSGGFGRAFADAGRRQWGQRMQNDVTDGVRHLTSSGRVDAQRICIVGISYGGYAALAGAALTPDLYRCAASIAGVSDLPQMLRWERGESGGRSITLDYWRRSIGDPDADRDMLDRMSPSLQTANIRAPILLIHGAEDDIVPVEQSAAMHAALQRAGRSTRFVNVPEARHPWADWDAEDRALAFREIEAFLAQSLAASP